MPSSIYSFQHYAFDIIIYLSYFLIVLAYFGIFNDATKYINALNYYLKIYVCLFLLWRFHPFRTTEMTEFDRKVAFRAGVFILTTTFINEYIVRILTYFGLKREDAEI